MHTQTEAHAQDAAYFGERGDWLIAATVTRDSGTLDRSNFRVMEAALERVDAGARSEDDEPATAIERSGHWAVGWLDRLLVRPGTEAAEEAKRLLDKLEDYPILDESDWSELEYETAAAYWASCSIRDRVDWCKRYRVSIFAARRDEIPEDQTGELLSALAE